MCLVKDQSKLVLNRKQPQTINTGIFTHKAFLTMKISLMQK
jgi:hypothetical protein